MTTRIKELPSAAGDIERQLNGASFAVNGGRSSESVADTKKAQLLWLTDVLEQFDRKESQDIIKYQDEQPKPANYYPSSSTVWTNWGAECCNAVTQHPTCSYFGPALQKHGTTGEWKCLCCVEQEKLEGVEMNVESIYSSEGHLNPLNTQDYTFDKVNQMEENVVDTHLAYFVTVLRSLTKDDHEHTDASGSKVTKKKTEFTVQKIKEPKNRFKEWVGLSLPIDPLSFRKLEYEMAINYGLRLSPDATKAQANLNQMNNCLIVLSKREFGEALTHFQSWFSDNFGNVDTMVGYLVMMKTIEFVSQLMRKTDEIVAYATYYRLRQGETMTSKLYLKTHEDNRREVVRTRKGKALDLKSDVMKFLEGFHTTMLASFKKKYAIAYKNQPYTWPIIIAVVGMMEDEKASDLKTTIDSKKMGAAIESRIQQVAAQTVAMAFDSGPGGSNQGGSSKKREYQPGFPCPACGSTKDKPIGSKHHFPSNCELWDFQLGVRENGDPYVAKCEKKSGCTQQKPRFQINKENGIDSYWELEPFRRSNQYKWMTKDRTDQKRKASGAMTEDKKSSKKKKGKGKKKAQQVSFAEEPEEKPSYSSGGFSDDWRKVFGAIIADVPDPKSNPNDVESVNVLEMLAQDEKVRRFLKLVREPLKIGPPLDEVSQIDASPKETNSQQESIGEQMMAPLMATTTVCSGVRTMSAKELEKGFSTDVDRRHVPYTNDATRDGAIQRSLKLKIPLDKAVANGNHLEWEQMVDSGAVDNYMAMALAMKILTQCVESVVDKGTFDKALRIQGAEPGTAGIYAIAWMKLKVTHVLLDGQIWEETLSYQILNRSIIQDIRGIKQISQDEALMHIHNQTSSANMRPEWYEIRNPCSVKIPLVRAVNHWSAKTLAVMTEALKKDLRWGKKFDDAAFMMSVTTGSEGSESDDDLAVVVEAGSSQRSQIPIYATKGSCNNFGAEHWETVDACGVPLRTHCHEKRCVKCKHL